MDFESAVVLATYPNHETAEAAVSLLASEGVEAVIASDDAGGKLPNLDVGRGVRVCVQERDAEFALGLLNVDADPEKIQFGMPVEVVFGDALGRKDKEGNSYLSYFFQPRS